MLGFVDGKNRKWAENAGQMGSEQRFFAPLTLALLFAPRQMEKTSIK